MLRDFFHLAEMSRRSLSLFNTRSGSLWIPVVPSDFIVTADKEIPGAIKVSSDTVVSVKNARYIRSELTLTATTNATINEDLSGQHSFIVQCGGTPGGPSAQFTIAKSTPTSNPTLISMSATRSADLTTNLSVSWPPNTPALLRKTTDSYDGTYIVLTLIST
jgi:hypothetical protein